VIGTAQDWLGGAVAVVIQVYFFAMGTTAVALYKFGPGPVPPRVMALFGIHRSVGGRSFLAGGLFWSSIALLLALGLVVSGLKLGSAAQVSAGVGSLAIDVVWLLFIRKWATDAK
jgi:hypothetical protein